MANILVTLTKVQATLPAGSAAFAQTVVISTDGAGAAQTANLNGTETPTPWAVTFQNVAPGAGNVVVTDTDANGTAIGAPITQPYNVSGGGTGGGTFSQTTGVTVVQQ